MFYVIALVTLITIVVAHFAVRYFCGKQTRELFIAPFIGIAGARGFISGLGIDPIQEDLIIKQAAVSSDTVDRKKLLKILVEYSEKRNKSSGRKLLLLAGFRSLDELD